MRVNGRGATALLRVGNDNRVTANGRGSTASATTSGAQVAADGTTVTARGGCTATREHRSGQMVTCNGRTN